MNFWLRYQEQADDESKTCGKQADLAQLVAYLDNRVCALSEVVETQQTRLGRLEQAGVERDRQIEYLLQRTASQAQRPYDHSHYFTPRGYPFISDMTPPRSAHDFSPTSSLPFFDASPTFHRRTVSTPVRPNLTHETLAYTSPEYLHLSQSESVPRSMPSPVQSMQARQSTPTSPGAESYPLDPQSFPRRHHLGSRRPAAHSRTSSSSGDWRSPSRSSAESRLDEEFSIRPLREEGYNYRNLLDTDSEIDEEVLTFASPSILRLRSVLTPSSASLHAGLRSPNFPSERPAVLSFPTTESQDDFAGQATEAVRDCGTLPLRVEHEQVWSVLVFSERYSTIRATLTRRKYCRQFSR